MTPVSPKNLPHMPPQKEANVIRLPEYSYEDLTCYSTGGIQELDLVSPNSTGVLKHHLLKALVDNYEDTNMLNSDTVVFEATMLMRRAIVLLESSTTPLPRQ